MIESVKKIIEVINSYSGPKYSELNQDIVALQINNWKNNGFFVEFGAMDGVSYSNTFLLEKEYGWNGIVCEPNRLFKEKIAENRKCMIDYRAVTNKSNEVLKFKETHEHLGMSGLVDFIFEDMHATRRKHSPGSEYEVNTISLTDLLIEYNAPQTIDYISMDTEGNELSILQAFDFKRFKINMFSIEHNYHHINRKAIQDIMESNNFRHILSMKSEYDDWFVSSELLKI
jgi:FkbM family methyltransferase